jgi:hypothetical protein
VTASKLSAAAAKGGAGVSIAGRPARNQFGDGLPSIFLDLMCLADHLDLWL